MTHEDLLTVWTALVEFLGAVSLGLSALYTIALVVPGKEPDATIKRILDFTMRFSRK